MIKKLPKPEKVLTEMQQKFLHYLVDTKGDVREAMRLAGYSDSTQQRTVLVTLQDEIVGMSKNLLAQSSMKAVMALVDTLDNPGKLGQSNAVNAAKEILDRIGITKPVDNGIINIKADNIMILPPKVKSSLTIDGEVNKPVNKDMFNDSNDVDPDLNEFDINIEDTSEFIDIEELVELDSNEFDDLDDIMVIESDSEEDN